MSRESSMKQSTANIDIDSDSDDEIIEGAMVRSMRQTIKHVGKTRHETEKAAGAKIKDVFKKSPRVALIVLRTLSNIALIFFCRSSISARFECTYT